MRRDTILQAPIEKRPYTDHPRPRRRCPDCGLVYEEADPDPNGDYPIWWCCPRCLAMGVPLT